MQEINNRPKQQSKKPIFKSQSLQKESKQLLIIKHKSNKRQHTNEYQSLKPYKLMTQLKNIFQKQLSSSSLQTTQNTQQQLSQFQGKYLLKLSQILQILTTITKQNNTNNNNCIITPQMLFSIINVQNQLNKLLLLFNNLIQNKQIVIAVFHQIYHKLMNHIISIIVAVKMNSQQQYVDNNMVQKIQKLINFLNKQLFDSIEFLLQLQCGMQQQPLFYQKSANNRTIINNGPYSQSNKNVIDKDKDREQMIKRLIQMFQTSYKYYKWIYEQISKHLLMIKQKHQHQQKHYKQQIITNTLSSSQLQLITLLHAIKQFSQMIIKYVEVINKLLH